MMKSSLRRLMSVVGDPILRVASRAYVPGPHLHDAMRWVRRMDANNVACTLGYFNSDGEVSSAIVRECCAAVEGLSELRHKGYVSIKAPALGYARGDLLEIADGASRHDQLVHFDSHGPETATPTLEALDALRGQYPKLGLTVPGRWRRSPDDADWATSRGVRVRVVKGQWVCPEWPDADPRDGFLTVIDRLAGRTSAAAVATHDAPLAREALSRLLRAGTDCELELLCGLPRRASMAVARELGVPVRLYVPFGAAWLPYALGQVARNPKMFSWVMRDTLKALFKA